MTTRQNGVIEEIQNTNQQHGIKEENISNETGETIANILTNHSMTLDEALDLVGAEPLEAENSCDPDYILNGVELWYDDLDLVPDNYGEESEDE